MSEKIVEFDKYCYSCQYQDCNTAEEPCNECLNHPVREDSHKPECYKEKEK